MSMTGSYKQSPSAKAAIEGALSRMEEDRKLTNAERKAKYGAERQASLARQKENIEKSKTAAAAREKAQLEKDRSNLPELEKQHSEMSAIHSKGKNWRYADREQNLSDEERAARDIEGHVSDLGNRISAVKRSTSSYAKGGKINLSNCGTSTASKGKNNSSW